jgi:predicted HD phosphohydrolase
MKRSDVFLNLLVGLADVYDEGPEGRDAVDQLEHSLQMGTRMAYAGAGHRQVALAVLHDAFRVVSPFNHGPALAEAINDRLTVNEQCILRYHSIWQNDILNGDDKAERFKSEPWYADGCRFGELDAASFDPEFESLPLRYFAPHICNLLDDDGSGAS